MKSREYRYRDFIAHLDVEAFEQAIEFEPLRQKLDKDGDTMDLGHCPDPWALHKHGDTTGKLAINHEKKVYNCFVCGGGTLLDLAMAVNEMTEQEAEEWLYQFARPVNQSNEGFMAEIDAILFPEREIKPEPIYYNERVLEPWTKNLAEIGDWLKGRGISEDVAARYSLGFNPLALRMAPIRSNKPREQAYEGPSVYLPHFWGDRLVGWQQRWLDDGRPKWVPKYTNTTGFPKNETIYNFETVYLADKPVIVVESVCTSLFLTSLGYPSVATFGSEITDEQMRLLRYFQQGVILAPDNDPPGFKWLGYTERELEAKRRGQKIERTVLADYLSRFIPVKIIEPVGDTGDDLGDIVSLGLSDARDWIYKEYVHATYHGVPAT